MGLSEPVPRKGAEALPQMVILPLLLRIGKDSIRFIDLLHLFLAAGIFVGMIAECKITISLFYSNWGQLTRSALTPASFCAIMPVVIIAKKV